MESLPTSPGDHGGGARLPRVERAAAFTAWLHILPGDVLERMAEEFFVSLRAALPEDASPSVSNAVEPWDEAFASVPMDVLARAATRALEASLASVTGASAVGPVLSDSDLVARAETRRLLAEANRNIDEIERRLAAE